MEVVSSCFSFLGGKRRVQYIKDFKENAQHLLSEWQELLAQERDVIHQVNRGKERLMNISNQNEVDHWLENVKGLKEPMNGIEREFGEDKRCLNRCLPNYYSRLKLAKEVQRLIKEVQDLSKKKPSVNVDTDQVPPARLGIPTEHFKGATAKMAFESILNCLMDKEIAKIGVYGMSGIGKTTIIKNIKNSLQKENIFNEIVFVTVSRFPIKAIQKAIADQIRLSVDKDYNEETLSIMLYEALQQRKRFLLILDDLWEKLPLRDIGIPEPHADCKVVLTTRSYSVCKSMGTQQEIKVEVLSQEDAWSLFQENAHMDDPYVKDIAKEVVKECGGLPLAIITVGQSLSGENDVVVWRNALNQLKGSTADIPGMEKGIFEKLKFCFDRLKDEKFQACFLYCSLFPEDFNIDADELIDHWIWDGLIVQMDNKQDEVGNGRFLLNELKRACMLEFDDGSNTVKMHDLMRDMAIGITRDNPRFMVKAGLGLEKAPAENEWPEAVERISLMYNDFEILSGQPRCPRLRTLLLNGNYSLLDIIPHSFFDNMCNLRVLDISNARIEMLPDSICNLVNLHVLLLNRCRGLRKMPSLAKLKELRVLRLVNTSVEEMPESLASLENLLELDLELCTNLKMLPSFAKLKKLRNLVLGYCTFIEELPESFSELENLLELKLWGCENLKKLPSFAKLKKLRNLDLSYCTSIEELPGSFSQLENLLELNLYSCRNLKMLPSFAKLKKLRNLDLSDCTSIEKLPRSFSELENLLELKLWACANLKKLPSFAKLKKLRNLDLSYCTSIKELPMSFSELENLLELNLYSCRNLKMLPSFAKLKKLRNFDLRQCTSIEELPGSFSEVENLLELNLHACENLKMLPSFAKLKQLRNLDLTHCTSIKELPRSFSELENLVKLNLHSCGNLKMLPSLAKLNELKILNLAGTSIEEFSESLSDLEKLCELSLECNVKLKMVPSLATLRNLRKLDLSFTSIEELPESLSDLEDLHELNLYNCKNLKRVPSLEKVEQLRILNLASTSIEELPEGMERLGALEILKLSDTTRLKRFPRGILSKLSLLQKFSQKGSSCLWSSNVAGMMEGGIDCNEIAGLTQLTKARFDCGDLTSFVYLFKILQERVVELRAFIKSSKPPLGEFKHKTSFLGFNRTVKCYETKKNEIRINELHDIICLSDLLFDLGSMELNACYIDRCDGMQCVLAGQDNSRLLLLNMSKIRVFACPKIKNLFSLQLSQSLQRLVSIEVKDCDMMEELIAGDADETGERIMLPNLQHLKLINLPALESINSKPLICNSLREIEIKRCPRLKKIPLFIDTLPRYFYGNFVGKKEWWDALDWHDPTNTKLLLQPFFNDDQEKGSSSSSSSSSSRRSRAVKSRELSETRQDAPSLSKGNTTSLP